MNAILITITEVDKRLRRMENSIGNNMRRSEPEILLKELEVSLPLTSLENFKDFERKLSKDEFLKGVAKYLKSCGGREAKSLIQNILKKCLSNELAIKFNMEGKNRKTEERKLRFKDTKLLGCRMKAILSYEIDETTLRSYLALWLAAAPLRLRRENGKQLKLQNSQEIDVDSINEANTSEEEEEPIL